MMMTTMMIIEIIAAMFKIMMIMMKHSLASLEDHTEQLEIEKKRC